MEGVRILVVLVCVGRIQLASGSCASGLFGDSCSYSCHCQTPCDETTGACTGDCDTGWRKAGGLCQKQNIALSKTASTTSGVYGDWYPSNAVDGDSDINGGVEPVSTLMDLRQTGQWIWARTSSCMTSGSTVEVDSTGAVARAIRWTNHDPGTRVH
ncbi:uncharacterized protein LOC124262852 [Haliotis rubra]|uniref:uncharacterized protein LOC124262852 n=1 Tax=Haliotis rubra TaxID=36100 RepID=UPI001EE54F91|nr:uncharacterized protein LOC124262852 [Haliotis rubra]